MIYVVLGMHKSGTTLIAEMLHRSGIDMMDSVDPSRGYDDGNKWERESTKSINHQLLGTAGAFSLRVSRHRPLRPSAELQAQMGALVMGLSAKHANWGFKDPRTCLTYDLWAKYLPAHRLIVIYRLPEEGWSHYWGRAETFDRASTTFRKFLPCWAEYNGAVLRVLQQTTAPAIVLHYTQLMADEAEFRRLEAFVGQRLVDVRQPGLSRSVAERSLAFRLAKSWHLARGGISPARIVAGLQQFRGSSPGKRAA